MAPAPRILLYILRKDLRLADNPVFHDISRAFGASTSGGSSRSYTGHSEKGLAKSVQQAQLPQFTHLLPIYIFPAHQVEVSGFVAQGHEGSNPYPPARSPTGGYWRCGPHRAKFLAESVYDTKQALQNVGSDLVIRVGRIADVLQHILQGLEQNQPNDTPKPEVVGVCLTKDVGVEESQTEDDLADVANNHGVKVHWWDDEKYLIDTEDLPFDNLSDLPNVFTSFRKSVEPLRENRRPLLPEPSSLPPLPEFIPPQDKPFEIPSSLEDLRSCLLKPLGTSLGLSDPPKPVESSATAHPFAGGSTSGQTRIKYLIDSGTITRYAETRNGMLGPDFSTKLSAFLSLGCISARQIHWAMYEFEEGKGQLGTNVDGYGKGENKGTSGVRFELLWRDYMRLVATKVGKNLFTVNGFPKSSRTDPKPRSRWAYLEPSQRLDVDPKPPTDADPSSVAYRLSRFLNGTTGTGLIDAAQRELFLTGYVSNRARQNVASYLAKHLKIDWRLGAEWYEMLLVDYDVASNWGNWQYVSGVGNDPRVERIFNPVKQALDYDPSGEYIKTWIPQLRDIEIKSDSEDRDTALMGLYQPWTLPAKEKQTLGVRGLEWAENPLLRINFDIKPKGKSGSRGRGGRGRGRGRGGGRSGGDRNWRRRGDMDRAGMNEGSPSVS